MGFFANLFRKLDEKIYGKIIQDFGKIPTHPGGGDISITLREDTEGNKPTLCIGCLDNGDDSARRYFKLSEDSLEKLEQIIKESRERIKSIARKG